MIKSLSSEGRLLPVSLLISQLHSFLLELAVESSSTLCERPISAKEIADERQDLCVTNRVIEVSADEMCCRLFAPVLS